MSRKSINFAPSNTDGLLIFDYNEGSKEKLTKKLIWSGARVAEEARLESVYTPKAYPEFESRSLRKIKR